MSNLATHSVEMDDFSPRLAMDIAADLLPRQEIFKAHGLSDTQGDLLLENPVFQNMVAEARTEWLGSSNAKERIRTKARLALEELLPTHFAMAVDSDVAPSNRNDAVKLIKDLAGIAPTSREGTGGDGGGGRFIVNINLDSTDNNITVDAPIEGFSEDITDVE